MKKKLLFLLILLVTLGTSFEILALETTWPSSPLGTEFTDDSTLTDMVRYFYEWGIFVGGIAFFISLLIGGFLHLTSMGNPARMNEAKDRIFSALIGLVLLLCIFLILNTINPELTILTMPTLKPPGETIKGICEASLYDQNSDHIIDLKIGERWNGDGIILIKKIDIEGTSCELILCPEINLGGDCESFSASVDSIAEDFKSAENKKIEFTKSCEKATLYDGGGNQLDVLDPGEQWNGDGTLIKKVDMEGICELKLCDDIDLGGDCSLFYSSIDDIKLLDAKSAKNEGEP